MKRAGDGPFVPLVLPAERAPAAVDVRAPVVAPAVELDTHAQAGPQGGRPAGSAIVGAPIAVAQAITGAGAASDEDIEGARAGARQLAASTDPRLAKIGREAHQALERVAKANAVELPIRARVATARRTGAGFARSDRTPQHVAGLLRDAGGKVTFYPADEALLPFDVDAALAKQLPRGVILVAHATKKRVVLTDTDGAPVEAGLYKLSGDRAAAIRGNFTGVVDFVDGDPFVRDMTKNPPAFHALPKTALTEGTVVQAHVEAGRVVVEQTLAVGKSAEARSWGVAAAQHLDPTFSLEAVAEARAIAAARGVDDRALVDLTAEPFFAIDNHGSRDIDQAMRLTRKPDGGFTLQYALADMAYAVKPGMALWDEAMRRGASFYIPGIDVPMQPRDVCERGVSLNAHEVHRALVMTVDVDKDGNVTGSSAVRAKIKSQAQLTYPGVTGFLERGERLDVDEHGKPVPPEVAAQIGIFQEIGSALRKRSHARGMTDPERRDMRIGLKGEKFHLYAVDDDLAGKLNAELSILANVAGAAMIAHPSIPGITVPGVYRIHPEPGPEKLAALRRLIGAVVDGNSAPPAWKWRDDESLADWVARIGAVPTNARERQLSLALQNQVLGIQVSSEYSRTPGLHAGLMVEGYGRFTAPMREVVGLLSHATLLQLGSLERVRALGVADADLPLLWDHMLLGAVVDPKLLSPERATLAADAAALEGLRGDALLHAARALLGRAQAAPAPTAEERALVDAVFTAAVKSGNSSRMKQKQCASASLRLVFDDLFNKDLGGVSGGPAPLRAGTITSVTPGKIRVQLDEPDVEVRLDRGDLAPDKSAPTFILEDEGAALVVDGTTKLRVGQAVKLYATWHDGDKLHFGVAADRHQGAGA